MLRCGDVEMCRCIDLEVWRFGDVKICRCEDVEI